ncbi:MAG TPA: YraN family protein [Dehalococcoidia bacterium]|nr:YraN family protein [Dehalococcoidia bacterium]
MPPDRRRNRSLGNFGERVAASHLESRGYRILERNWSCRQGEVDLIATRGDDLVFVEVRSRKGGAFGTPEESITGRKRQHLLDTIAAYMAEHPDSPPNQRIDLVVLELDRKGRVMRVEQIENAIEGE